MNKKTKHYLKILGKWGLTGVILGFVFASLDYDQFVTTLKGIPIVNFFTVMLIFILVNTLIETFSLASLLRNFTRDYSYSELFAIRCKTYILAMAHQNIGLGGMGYFLKKKYNLSIETSGSMVILLFFSDAIAMSLIGLVFLAAVRDHQQSSVFLLLYALLMIIYGSILLSLKSTKRLRARWYQRLSAEMRRVSATRYFRFLGFRVLFITSIITASYFILPMFGCPISVNKLLAIMPACIIVGFLPLTPFGIGTYPAAMALFLSPYAASEGLMAFSLCYLFTVTILRLPLGLAYWGRD